MRKEASLEQWRSLYEVAIKFKTLKPWNNLWDIDLTEIVLPEYEKPFFCSVMGRAGECIAIGSYILHRKYDDKSKLWLTSEASNTIPPRISRHLRMRCIHFKLKVRGLFSHMRLHYIYTN